MATLMQETAHKQRAISSPLEAVGRELEQYALARMTQKMAS